MTLCHPVLSGAPGLMVPSYTVTRALDDLSSYQTLQQQLLSIYFTMHAPQTTWSLYNVQISDVLPAIVVRDARKWHGHVVTRGEYTLYLHVVDLVCVRGLSSCRRQSLLGRQVPATDSAPASTPPSTSIQTA